MGEKEDINITGVSLNSPGFKHIGFVGFHKFGGTLRAVNAIVKATGATPIFALQLDGANLAASMSVAAVNTAEVVTMTENQYRSGVTPELGINVITSGAGGTADIGITVEKL